MRFFSIGSILQQVSFAVRATIGWLRNLSGHDTAQQSYLDMPKLAARNYRPKPGKHRLSGRGSKRLRSVNGPNHFRYKSGCGPQETARRRNQMFGSVVPQ